MPIDQELNKILKEMWSLDEKENLNDSEKEFYNNNLDTIKNYYFTNNKYWQGKQEK
jgi:hypothetical protein